MAVQPKDSSAVRASEVYIINESSNVSCFIPGENHEMLKSYVNLVILHVTC